MFSVKAQQLPKESLLNFYANQTGCYTDCYSIDVSGNISLKSFIHAFFSTAIFRLERLFIRLLTSRASTNEDVKSLASGNSNTLAVWNVDKRTENQLIMSVGNGPIRSWLMVGSIEADSKQTRLYFGTAVLPKRKDSNGKPHMGFLFYALLGFHKFYSKTLLELAKRKL